MSTIEEAQDLFEKAYEMKPSRKRADMAYRAFEMAQSVGEKKDAFESRLLEVESRIFSEDYEKALIAFAWLLAEYRKNKEEYQEFIYTFLWSAKWIAGSMDVHIAVPKEKIDEHLELYKSLLQEHGYNESSYWQQKAKVASGMGLIEESLEYGEKSLQIGQDALSDCAECTREHITDALFLLGRYDEFFTRGEEFRTGAGACPEPMIDAMGNTAVYYVMKNEPEQVKYYLFKAEKIAKKESDDPDAHMESKYIFSQTKIDNVDAALGHFESSAAFVYRECDPIAQYEFLKASGVLFDVLAKKEEKIVMHLSEDVPWYKKSNEYSTKEVAAALHTKTKELAALIDTRNGNSYYTDGLELFCGVPIE